MGHDELHFAAESIQRSGDGIRASAERMRSSLIAFKTELDGHGQPWGDDDLGSAIGMCYQAIYEMAMETYGGNIAVLDADGERVTLMGDVYGGGERHNDLQINRVREILG